MNGSSVTKDDVVGAIFAAVDEINASLPNGSRLEKDASTALFGTDSTLDSFALVNLVIGAEQQLQDRLGIAITLASEKAMSRHSSPFRTIDTLADYALELIHGSANDG